MGATQVVVRAPASPTTAAAIRGAMAELDPAVSVTPVIPLEEYTAIAILPQRAAALLTVALGGLALFLCALGLYGIVAHDVSRRTREIGVRIAVGARRTDVARLVFGGAVRMALPGIAAGSLLGLSPLDPLALTVSIAVLLAAVTAAVVVPARRAVSVQPVEALRSE
jgi:putative ABC transport system permease protein